MDHNSVLHAAVDVDDTSPSSAETSFRGGKGQSFTDEQRKLLLKYFDEYGMTSTHRRNTDLMQKCAQEVGTTIDRVKNWIGSEAVKRKRKAGILPRPKIEITGSSSQTKFVTPPPAKKFKRVNGYNLFFSYCVRNYPDISTDFRQRNAIVAQRWAELTEEERKHWALKAESVCSSSVQEPGAHHHHHQQHQPQHTQQHLFGTSMASMPPEMTATTENALVEKTLLAVQEKFDLLEQLGFEGYAILVNTSELQTHLLATSKGKAFHRAKQMNGKPLENPFIGYVFTDDSDSPSMALSCSAQNIALTTSPNRRFGDLVTALNSVDTMQKSVMNAFALKYSKTEVATGRTEIPYDNLQNLGVQVYGMPPGIPFLSPLLYTQQQLQQILANLEKIVFLKVPQDSGPSLSELDISTDAVASLVSPGHELHIGAEEEATQ